MNWMKMKLKLRINFNIKNNYMMMKIQLLYDAYPKSVQVRDMNGMLPLHVYMCNPSSSCSIDIVNYLIEKFPGGLNIKNAKGKTPKQLYEINKHEPSDEEAHNIIKIYDNAFSSDTDMVPT